VTELTGNGRGVPAICGAGDRPHSGDGPLQGAGMVGRLRIKHLFRWTRARPEPEAIDAADLGTAFGMELSIDEARQRAVEVMRRNERTARTARTQRSR
jgi:hypothetical protein